MGVKKMNRQMKLWYTLQAILYLLMLGVKHLPTFLPIYLPVYKYMRAQTTANIDTEMRIIEMTYRERQEERIQSEPHKYTSNFTINNNVIAGNLK